MVFASCSSARGTKRTRSGLNTGGRTSSRTVMVNALGTTMGWVPSMSGGFARRSLQCVLATDLARTGVATDLARTSVVVMSFVATMSLARTGVAVRNSAMTVLGIEEGKSEVALATQRKGRGGAAAAWVASLSFFIFHRLICGRR